MESPCSGRSEAVLVARSRSTVNGSDSQSFGRSPALPVFIGNEAVLQVPASGDETDGEWAAIHRDSNHTPSFKFRFR